MLGEWKKNHIEKIGTLQKLLVRFAVACVGISCKTFTFKFFASYYDDLTRETNERMSQLATADGLLRDIEAAHRERIRKCK